MTSTDSVPPTHVDVVLARLEAKIDVALAQHGSKLEQHGQEIGELRTRIDKIEDRPIATPEGIMDHEQRLRVIEKQPYVTTNKLVGAMALMFAAISALLPLIERLYS